MQHGVGASLLMDACTVRFLLEDNCRYLSSVCGIVVAASSLLMVVCLVGLRLGDNYRYLPSVCSIIAPVA